MAALAGGKFGFLTSGGNTVGGYLAGAVPGRGGKNAAAMLAEPLKAYVVLHAEPLLDADNGGQAVAALRGAQFAVALTRTARLRPTGPMSCCPCRRSPKPRAPTSTPRACRKASRVRLRRSARTRPGWKVLRVLGNVLHLAGFDDETSESVRDTVLAGGVENRLSNAIKAQPGLGQVLGGLERVADVPIYRSDAMVRRSEPLQAAPARSSPPRA